MAREQRNEQDALQAILDHLDKIDGRFDRLETDISQLKTDVREIRVVLKIDEEIENLKRLGRTG